MFVYNKCLKNHSLYIRLINVNILMLQYSQDCIFYGFVSKAIFFWEKYYQTPGEFLQNPFFLAVSNSVGQETMLFSYQEYLTNHVSAQQN